MIKTPFGWLIMKRVPPPPPDTLDSVDILKREPPDASAKVKHVLLGWTAAHTEDPRGAKRTRAELEKLVKATVARLKKGDKIDDVMSELSEDPSSAKTGRAFDVTPDAGLVAPFTNLSLRLKVGEVGVVKSDFGIHIIQRIDPAAAAAPPAGLPPPETKPAPGKPAETKPGEAKPADPKPADPKPEAK
jgi:hypothetical protein